MSEVSIRGVMHGDIPAILDIVRSVNRYVNEDELLTWMKFDPEGILVAEYEKDNNFRDIVGTCARIALTDDCGFMGLYMVKEEYRGRGIGTKLWHTAMKSLGDRNIGVCFNANDTDVYQRKYGFQHLQNYKMIYFESFELTFPPKLDEESDIFIVSLRGKGLLKSPGNFDNSNSPESFRADDSTEVAVSTCEIPHLKDETRLKIQNASQVLELSAMTENSSDIQCFDGDLLRKILAYDQSLHGYDRSLVIKEVFHWQGSKTKVALSRSGHVLGYGCVRPVVTGHAIISPLYADSSNAAEVILRSLLHEVDFADLPKGLIIRFPDTNTAFRRLVKAYGFKETDLSISNSFTKRSVSVDTSKIYATLSTVFCGL